MKTEQIVKEFMVLCKAEPSEIEQLSKSPEFKSTVEFWNKHLLDAMKHGMRKAAEMVEQHQDLHPMRTYTEILTAAEQLTTKELE